ncbi:MAG: endonuclease III [Clostridiales bacterium]|nr:endonuclease III [Clostridiales bacterium]
MKPTKNQQEILRRMEQVYADAKPALHFQNAYELLVATILSAQCTDVRVNKVTKDLFVHYKNAEELSRANYSELCDEIHSCGCYAVKAKNLINTAKLLMEQFGGEVPQTMEELTTLPGVGRKTANVVLSNAFGIPGFAVDTHVFRVSNRLGLAHAKDVAKTEEQLCALVPREKWGNAHHWLIYHGRQICSAHKPKCGECFLKDICPSSEAEIQDKAKEA